MAREFNRADRVGQRIQRELAKIIQTGVKDPRLPPFVSISAVEVSRDLAYAKVYITALGDADKGKLAVEILKHAAGYLRSTLAKLIQLRVTPELRFIYDESMEHGRRISQLMNDVDDESQD